MSIQQDVIDTIGPGGIEKERLRERVGNIGEGELNCVVNALMRAGRLRLVFGRYEIVESKRPLGDTRGRPPARTLPSPDNSVSAPLGDCPDLPAPVVAQLSSSAQREIAGRRAAVPNRPPPDAATEAAASLRSTSEPTAYCTGCKERHPESAFKRGASSGRLYNQCREYRSAQARKSAAGAHADTEEQAHGGLATAVAGEASPANLVDADRAMTEHVAHRLSDARVKEAALVAELESIRARIGRYERFLELEPPEGAWA